jgi:hypothetical protein
MIMFSSTNAKGPPNNPAAAAETDLKEDSVLPQQPVETVTLPAGSGGIYDLLRTVAKTGKLNVVVIGPIVGQIDRDNGKSINGLPWPIALKILESSLNLQTVRQGDFVLIKQMTEHSTPIHQYTHDWTEHDQDLDLGLVGDHSGETVDFDLAGKDIRDVLQSIAPKLNKTMVVDLDVSGDISVLAQSKPITDVLLAVLYAADLDAESAGSSIHVWRRSKKRQSLSTLQADEGSIRCVVGFEFRTVERSTPVFHKSEFTFLAVPNGKAATFESGPQAPIVTQAQLGGPPTVTYLNAGTSINLKVRLAQGAPTVAWFDIEAEHASLLQNSIALGSKTSDPSIKSVKVMTDLAIKENTETEIGGYEDPKTNEKAVITIKWSSISTPALGLLPVPPDTRHIISNLFYTQGLQTSHYWVVSAANSRECTIIAGLRIPVVTAAQLGGPPTSTYIDAFAHFILTSRETGQGGKLSVLEFQARFTKGGILARPYTTAGDNPFLDRQSLMSDGEIAEGAKHQIGVIDDGSSSRSTALFSWNWSHS